MKCISIACLFLLGSCQAAAQSAQGPVSPNQPDKEKCTVAGIVVRLDTGEPLKKATVVLWSRDSGEHSFFAITDDQGHFLLEDLPPGLYSLDVTRNGYVRVQYGQKKPGDPGAGLTLTPGAKMTDLLFKLPRAAVITGHVSDEGGEPLSGAEVKAYQAHRRRGTRQLGTVKSTSTNDLGEYRLFGLEPGHYYVAASYSARENIRGLTPSSPQLLNTGYVLTFYPNTTEPSKAQTVTVNAGDEFPSVDFMMKPTHLVTVSGKVLSALPGGQGGRTTVSLQPRDGARFENNLDLYATTRNKDGGFEIQGVPPGSYYIIASWRDDGANVWYRASRELEVGNSGMDEVTLSILRGVDVPGHLAWEGKAPADVQNVHVALRALNEGSYFSNYGALNVNADGSFLIKNVQEGLYGARVLVGNPDCFLKSARYESANVLEGGLTVRTGRDATLELTMSSHAPRVEGVVVNADSLPAVGVYVVLIPDAPHRQEEWNYHQETTDQNGRFTLRGITPGDYKIFSWDSAEDFDWYDPEFVKPYEPQGISVSVVEGDRKSVQITLIEPTKAPQASQ
jgi:carboxypeptidase family protein